MTKLCTMFLAVGLAIFAAGCGGTPYEYSSANDTKPGPGLLSGDDGVFNILGAPLPASETSSEQGESEKQGEIPAIE